MAFTFDDFSCYISVNGALALTLIFFAYTAASRLLLHPLKSFPGPRLASVTDLYAAYYELWEDGQLVSHLKELHDSYGPVVRIRPNELHFNTAEAYFSIYPPLTGFLKDPKMYASFGVSESTSGFIDVKDVKKRRDLINPLFSRRAIMKFERSVQDIIDVFIQRLREYGDMPVKFQPGFRALTMDIITMYSCGHTFGGIETPEFDHAVPKSLNNAVVLMAVSRYLPWLRAIRWLPPSVFVMLNPSMAGFANLTNSIRKSVEIYLVDPDSFRKAEQETIYHHLLPESVDPSQWPSKASLVDETVSLISAGTDTTSNALNRGLFHLLLDDNKDILKKLEDELKKSWPEIDSPFLFEQAEKLPYLTGVVKESLRLGIGIPLPLSRLVMAPTTICGAYVPAGTVVGVSAQFLLLNPEIFPQPDKFIPERWMQSNTAELEKHLVTFSRGPRTCLGMNLAWCEMYLVISHLVRKFDMKLYDTSVDDMETRDYILPAWRGKGLRAVVKERKE